MTTTKIDWNEAVERMMNGETLMHHVSGGDFGGTQFFRISRVYKNGAFSLHAFHTIRSNTPEERWKVSDGRDPIGDGDWFSIGAN